MRKLLIGLVSFLAIAALAGLWFATLGRAPEDPTLFPEYDASKAAPPPSKAATQRREERNVFFGDLHIHTRLSLDAYRFGVTAGPEDAYVYARGGTIEHGAGYAIRLKEPLDFAAVTDHAEYLGMLDGLGLELPLHGGRLRETLLGRNRLSATSLFFETLAEFEPPAEGDQGYDDDPAIMRAAWQRTIDAADQANQPGVFTSFVAYEWSAVSDPGNDNLHRNVIYRGSEAPTLPFSSHDSKDPEDLWTALEAQLAEGIEAIEAAAAEAGRVFDDDHYGVLIPYLPPGLDIPAEALERVTVRRPDAAPEEVIAMSHKALHDMIDAYVEVGATKFVCFPFGEPADWHAELEQLAPILEKQT